MFYDRIKIKQKNMKNMRDRTLASTIEYVIEYFPFNHLLFLCHGFCLILPADFFRCVQPVLRMRGC